MYLHLDNEALMEKIKTSGDKDAFELLYDRLSLKLYNFVYRIVNNSEKAEEIVHDSFFKLYDKRQSFEVGKRMNTWLWNIARNTAYDTLKKKREVLLDADSSLDELIEDCSPDVLEKLIKESESKRLKEALMKLPDAQKDALNLWLEDMSLKEIAEIMDKSEQAIKNLINRAKTKLKNILEEK